MIGIGTGTTRVSPYAWYVVTVLMLCYTLSFIDRQILSLLVAPIKTDLGISDTRVGLLQGFSFALFYALMGLPLGRIADLSNRRNLISIGILFWSFFTTACAGAKSFVSLFLARMGVGVGEAALNPASFSILADYFPKERLGVAVSVFYFGNLLGSSLALIVGGTTVEAVTRLHQVTLPLLGTIAAWRLTFLILGIPGVLFALLAFTIKEPLRKSLLRNAAGATKLSIRETAIQVQARWQSVAGLSIGFAFQSACVYGFGAWAPTYFLRAHGWTVGTTGRPLGLITLIFGCLGLYVGGALSERWQRRGITDAPLRVAIPSAIGAGVFLPLAMLMPAPWFSLALIGPGFFFLVLPMGTAGAALQLIFPNQVRAQVSALCLFILNLGGLSLGPLLPGVFTDYLFKDPKMVGASLALTIAISAALMLLIICMTLRPYRRHYQEMHPSAT
jgi:MFS family permease